METEIKNMEHPLECECPRCLKEIDAILYHNEVYEMVI